VSSSSQGSPDTAPKTVVVADDDPVTLRLVESQLDAAGFRPVVAVNGQAALRAVMAEKPGVLILDLAMPGLDGFDVLERLNMLSSFPRPKVLVVSAGRDAEDVKRALTLGADDYLAKPFKPEELLARVNRFA
jgi:DNA-binding response OmpR family regulator